MSRLLVFTHVWALIKKKQRKSILIVTAFAFIMQLHVIIFELTFARRHAIIPLMINIAGAKSSAVLEPSTTRSATTDSA